MQILCNAAITLGRLACVSPDFLNGVAKTGGFIGLWATALSTSTNKAEKTDGFLGLLSTLNKDLNNCLMGDNMGISNVRGVILSVASWHVGKERVDEKDDEDALREMDHDVLHGNRYHFAQFPNDNPIMVAVGTNVKGLVGTIAQLCGRDEWHNIKGRLPSNIVRLLSEEYQL